VSHVLILGGTTEAVALAEALAEQRPDLKTVTSLAGVTRDPVTGPGTIRRGGFGGAEGLAVYLRDEAIDVLVDATHPFAATMAEHAAQAAAAADVPRIKLVRPPWSRTDHDTWIEVDDAGQAADAVAHLDPGSVLLTLGRRDLAPFVALEGIRFTVRMIEPPGEPLPFADARLLLARGPFTIEDEMALMRDHSIDMLVTKASGGEATEAKIVAARRLRLPVVMLRRPATPPGPTADSVEAVLAWVDQRL